MDKIKLIIIAAFFSLACSSLLAMDLKREINLKGEWRFEIGNNLSYKEPDFDDSKWEKIKVPDRWENEGFPGYDGYAWYRITFNVPSGLKAKKLYLQLGRIDAVDRVYLNGKLVGGKGKFPPQYDTAWEERRRYLISPKFLKFGTDNVLAVQVYDDHGSGGIVEGDVGIYSRRDVLELKINLRGQWKFSTGDNLKWTAPDYNDSKWKTIAVPCYWEKQGFKRYDGIAWYRKKIKLPATLFNEKLILMLGKINDIDQVYFNGSLIGYTGEFPRDGHKAKYKDMKNKERAYFIPPHLIRPDGENVIAVRVLDVGKYGGIYKGYIGITTRGEYLKYSKRK